MSQNPKSKAVDINVESLKLYITISTIAIGGLLTFFRIISSTPKNISLFYWAMILLLLSAISSILVVNHFIIQAHENEFNVRTSWSRILNWGAIIFFFSGISLGGIFVANNASESTPLDLKSIIPDGIVIQKNVITIGKDVRTEVIIKTDSISNSKVIFINH